MSNEIVKAGENNFFSGAVQKAAPAAEAIISRQAQEVQAAMIIAKKFPRSQVDAFNRIMQACQRKSLAECAVYEYPRGGQKVSGPSIRMAEVLAQNWGNMDFGIVELERGKGESQVMAYAWDLETNTRQTKVFTVKHWRDRKDGKGSALTEERDIYEIVANQGARRVRACILGIIPGDIVDNALVECEETMKRGEKEPLADRIRNMVFVFSSEFNVSKAQIEKRFQHNVESLSENEMVSLKKIYRSLKDNMAEVGDFFDPVSGLEKKSDEPKKQEVKNDLPSAFSGTPMPPVKASKNSISAALEGKPVTLEQIEGYLKKTGKLLMTMSLEKNKFWCDAIIANPDKICGDCMDWMAKEGGK